MQGTSSSPSCLLIEELNCVDAPGMKKQSTLKCSTRNILISCSEGGRVSLVGNINIEILVSDARLAACSNQWTGKIFFSCRMGVLECEPAPRRGNLEMRKCWSGAVLPVLKIWEIRDQPVEVCFFVRTWWREGMAGLWCFVTLLAKNTISVLVLSFLLLFRLLAAFRPCLVSRALIFKYT